MMDASSSQPNVEVANGQVTVGDGVKIYYEIRSPKSSVAPKEDHHKMVMIMGAFGTLKHFEEQADFMVQHLSSTQTPLQILTFDNRGIGKSAPVPRLKQTTRMLADDTLSLINQVWGEKSLIHVYGASLGGMIAQELAVRLIQTKRLASLYLAVTSRGTFVRPMAMFSTGVWSALMPLLIKQDHEKMVREVLLPASFSPQSLTEQGERYAQMWLSDYDAWWAFGNREACACQSAAAASHYLTNDSVRILCESNIPITVQIATKDKLMPALKQYELASLLNAKTVVFHYGHMGDDKAKKEVFESAISHLENAIMARY